MTITIAAIISFFILIIIFIAGFYLINTFDGTLLLPALFSSYSIDIMDKGPNTKKHANDNFKQIVFSDDAANILKMDKNEQECAQTINGRSGIVGVNASSFVPPHKAENVADSNLGTAWSALGKGSWIELDLGCERMISTLEIAWHESDKRKNVYTVQVLPDDKRNIVDEFNYTSNILPLDITYQSSGVNNTKGRYVKIILDQQLTSIREISVYVVPPSPADFYKLNKERWNESFPYYPHALTITNSNGTIVNVPLTTISDGDSDPIRNPNYHLPRDPVIILKVEEPFRVSIDWNHIEGIDVGGVMAVNENRSIDNDSSNINYNNDSGQMLTISSLNNTNAIYEGKNTKHFVFVPQAKTNSTATPVMDVMETYTLTIFVAIADDTSIGFQTKVFLIS
jgi:hypothetical protein